MEMRNVIDLISLYISINQQVVDQKQEKRSGRFNEYHQTLLNIKESLNQIRVDLNNPAAAPVTSKIPPINNHESSIWEYFALITKLTADNKTLSSLTSQQTKMPNLVNDKQNFVHLDELDLQIE